MVESVCGDFGAPRRNNVLDQVDGGEWLERWRGDGEGWCAE